MLGRPAFEINSLNLTVDEYFNELNLLEEEQQSGPFHAHLDEKGNLVCSLEEWAFEEDATEQQELLLASNVEGTRIYYESATKAATGYAAPRDSYNRWVMRSIVNHFDGIQNQADEMLVDELVSSSPCPFVWVDDKRQLFNYIQRYNLALKELRNRGWIKRLEYATISKCIVDLKLSSFDEKFVRLKKIREDVSSIIRYKVEDWVRPLIATMRAKLFLKGEVQRKIVTSPPLVVGLYGTDRCQTNYHLYLALMGDRGKGYQIRVAKEIYDLFSDDYVEGFASPLNHVKRDFYSIFESDKRFGSLGSIYKTRPLTQKYLLNPPFMEDFVLDVFERFRDAEVVFLYLAASETNVSCVKSKGLEYEIVKKELFPYEQLFEKNSPPGKPVKFYFIENTIIVWWGKNKKEIEDMLVKIRKKFPS